MPDLGVGTIGILVRDSFPTQKLSSSCIFHTPCGPIEVPPSCASCAQNWWDSRKYYTAFPNVELSLEMPFSEISNCHVCEINLLESLT